MSKETNEFVKCVMEKKDSEAKRKLKDILKTKVINKIESVKD